jgi:transcriptional regulator with XRE-family HTH domain
MRDGAFAPVAIPAEFWARPDVTRALARRDIGAVFRFLTDRDGPGPRLTQMQVGTATGTAQGRISAIARGKHEVKTAAVLARIADGLGMAAQARAALGLAPVPGSRPSPARPAAGDAVPGPEYPATTTQAVATAAALWQADAARSGSALSATVDPAAWNGAALSWMLGQPDRELPTGQGRQVGPADVARVRASTALFAELDNRFGGPNARRPLINFLASGAAALLHGSYTGQVGRDLFAAVADASLLLAWTSYDSGLHGLAQRYFVHALRLAQTAGDRQLACSVMSAMSHQATFLGHLPEAANLARAAREGLRDLATPVLTAQFAAMEARARARAGDAPGCHAALAIAERAFSDPEPGRDPAFIAYFTQAELSAEIAHCFRDLGDPARAARHAALAAPSDGTFARSDYFVIMVRANALADQGDADQACAVALEALRAGQALTSARAVAYMRRFRRRLADFGDAPAVRALADQSLWTKAA